MSILFHPVLEEVEIKVSPAASGLHRKQVNRCHQLRAKKPFKKVLNTIPPIKPLSDDHIEAIHHASLDVIKTLGIKVLSPSARQHLREQGCDVDEDTEIVKMDPEFVTSMVAKAPSRFTLTPRNPERYRIGR